MRWLLLVAIIVMLLGVAIEVLDLDPLAAIDARTAQTAAVPTSPPVCSLNDGRKAVEALMEFAQEWDDALELASQTPRISLSPQIGELQRIRRAVQQQTWPPCAESAHDALVKHMDKMIEGFLAYLGNEPESVYNAHLNEAKTLLEAFTQEMARLRASGG